MPLLPSLTLSDSLAQCSIILHLTFLNRQLLTFQYCRCRGVESICRRGKDKADQLYRHLEQHCHTHIKDGLLPDILRKGDSNSVETLRAVETVWGIWRTQLVGLQISRLIPI